MCGPYRKRVAIKRHEFLRKPKNAVVVNPAESSLEVSRCAVRTTVETSAWSSLLPAFATGSARVSAFDRATATPTHLLLARNAALTPSYVGLLEAA